MPLTIQSISYPASTYTFAQALAEIEGMGLDAVEVSKSGDQIEAVQFASDGTEKTLVINPKMGVVVRLRETDEPVNLGGALTQKVIPFGGLELGLEYSPGAVRHPHAGFARKAKHCYGHVRKHWEKKNKALDFWGHPGLIDPDQYGTPSEKMYLLSQADPRTGEFDEHKLLVGFESMSKAVQAYLEEMPEEFMSSVKPITVEGLNTLTTEAQKTGVSPTAGGLMPAMSETVEVVETAETTVQPTTVEPAVVPAVVEPVVQPVVEPVVQPAAEPTVQPDPVPLYEPPAAPGVIRTQDAPPEYQPDPETMAGWTSLSEPNQVIASMNGGRVQYQPVT